MVPFFACDRRELQAKKYGGARASERLQLNEPTTLHEKSLSFSSDKLTACTGKESADCRPTPPGRTGRQEGIKIVAFCPHGQKASTTGHLTYNNNTRGFGKELTGCRSPATETITNRREIHSDVQAEGRSDI